MRIAKYAAVFMNAWQQQFTYRVDTLLFFAVNLIFLISTFFLWDDIFADRAAIAGFTKSQIVTYFLLLSYISASLNPGLGVSPDIGTGTITNILIRPISYLWMVYARSLARCALRLLFGLPIVVAIFLVMRGRLSLATDPRNYLMLLLAMFGAFNLFFLFQMLIELMEFWFKYADTLNIITDAITRFFAGTLIPLALMPEGVQRIAGALPFQYTGSFLMDAFFGRVHGWGFLSGIAVQCAWTAAFVAAASIVWRIGLRRYEAYGS